MGNFTPRTIVDHRNEQSARLRQARTWLRRRAAVHTAIEWIFETFLFGYQLPHNSRWSLFADMFWIECPICFFYRGATFGFLLASGLAMLGYYFTA